MAWCVLKYHTQNVIKIVGKKKDFVCTNEGGRLRQIYTIQNHYCYLCLSNHYVENKSKL